MGKFTPINVDELFVLGVLLVFLMINWDLPLASIYSDMALYTILMYLVPLMFGLFTWPKVSDKKNFFIDVVMGVGIGLGFIQFYKTYISGISSMAAVFATTAFGDSVSIGQGVFGFIIPIVESTFFFVVIPG